MADILRKRRKKSINHSVKPACRTFYIQPEQENMYSFMSWTLSSLLLALLIDAKENGCPQSIPTMNVVKRCPKDSTEWIKAKERKQCHLVVQNCSKLRQEFVYHCLPNKVLDSLIEVCAPTKIIVGNYCPFYDLRRNTIGPNFNQPCKDHVKKCANVYTSNSVHRYQECYEEIQENTTDDPEKRIFLDPALTNGIYVICAILAAVLLLFAIRIYLLRPCVRKDKRGGNGNYADTHEKHSSMLMM
ncbi:uncharacterized protein LOC125677722 isoform X2 [Ostrea edulis]|uniref:uncharacterized protein LOC125677722 isoform X2 n=1 Tax=Ostrea edulis TaxID=37623 RepID=UPI0024AF69D4|nr:uncharacterized protein LOC125677722 isoform X2 [Ostrea edulis]XP_056013986.1 uncharacterized protein LOC125677722 isoform X2 [Ostrea edulis]